MRKPFGPRPVGELIPACLGELSARRGFAGAEILARWQGIAGEAIAAHARPVRLQWPPRGGATDPDETPAAAVLHIRVEGAFALELQYEADRLVERINAYLGWRCVGSLRMRQGPVEARSAPRRSKPAPIDGEAERRLAASLAPVAEEPLAASLEKLGRAVLARRVTRP
jgi:hypothetical protein